MESTIQLSDPLEFRTAEGIVSPLHNTLASFVLENETATLEELQEKFGLSPEGYSELLPQLCAALQKRGWDLPDQLWPVVKKAPQKQLDPFFTLAVELICDFTDKRAKGVKIKAAGLTSLKFNRLLDDKRHSDYFEKKLAAAKKKAASTADVSLIRLVDSGDLQGIKYFNEFTGRYKEDGVAVNLIGLLSRMMEILARHVEPGVLTIIADEIETNVLGELESGST